MFHFSSAMPVIDSKMYSLPEERESPRKLLHGDCRLMAVLKGEITVTSDKEAFPLKEQDVIFLPDRMGYGMHYSQNSILFYISFHPCFLLEALGPYYTKLRFRPGRVTQEFSEELCKKMAELSQMAAPGSGASKCELYSVALDLLHRLQVPVGSAEPADKPDKKQEKIARLHSYVNEHYSGATSLGEAAEALQYTPQYLANFIKKNLGKTYHDLLSDFRAAAAETYLRYTDDNISRVAAACGFSNAAALQKAFQEKGLTAESFKGKTQAAPGLPPDFGAVSIDHPTARRSYFANYLNYVGSPGFLSGDAAVVKKHVHVNRHKKLNTYWRKLINLGPAAGFEQNAFRRQLQALQRDIGFTYGRVSGLLNLIERFQTDEGTRYNFFSVFKVIDHLLSIGMKPFLDIDNKPFDIYKADEKSQKNFHAYLHTDEYDRFLYDVLPELIRGCINRYGYDEFSGWKFELWQRYTPAMESLESAKSFVSRFKKVSEIFERFHSGYSLGGPCFNPYLPSRNFEQIITAFRQADISPDFISVIYFPYIPGEPISGGRLKDYHVVRSARDMAGKMAEFRDIIDRHDFSGTDFFITEYTSYIITGNYINDSAYPAAFILKQATQGYGTVDAIGWWLASDLSLEYSRSSLPFFGGNGMLSKSGIKKAPYYAHEFLGMLGEDLCAMGENFIVTASGPGKIQVLLFLSSDITSDYRQDPVSANLLYYPYHGFSHQVPVKFELDLMNLLPGKYSIREFSLDLEHGNILTAWGQLNHTAELHESDHQYIAAQSAPAVRQHIETLPERHTLSTLLTANAIKLFIFERYS